MVTGLNRQSSEAAAYFLVDCDAAMLEKQRDYIDVAMPAGHM